MDSMALWRTSIRLALVVPLFAAPLAAAPPCEKDVHLIFQAEPLGEPGILWRRRLRRLAPNF